MQFDRISMLPSPGLTGKDSSKLLPSFFKDKIYPINLKYLKTYENLDNVIDPINYNYVQIKILNKYC